MGKKTEQKNQVTEPEKPKTFREKIEAEIADLPDSEKLQVIVGKLESNREHIEEHKEELSDLEASYEQEKEAQAKEIDALRDKLFDQSAGKMLDELLKIGISGQKKQLLDSIEKVRTNLLAFTMNQKDLLSIKREIEHRIDENERDERVRELAVMIENTCEKILNAEDSFSQMKELAIQVSVNEPGYWARADKLKLPPWMIQLMGLSNMGAGSLPRINVNSWAEMCGNFPDSPLAGDRQYQRRESKHVLEDFKGENIRGQLATEAELETALSRSLTGGGRSPYEMPVVPSSIFNE